MEETNVEEDHRRYGGDLSCTCARARVHMYTHVRARDIEYLLTVGVRPPSFDLQNARRRFPLAADVTRHVPAHFFTSRDSAFLPSELCPRANLFSPRDHDCTRQTRHAPAILHDRIGAACRLHCYEVAAAGDFEWLDRIASITISFSIKSSLRDQRETVGKKNNNRVINV